jgi:putative addiction module component (TIGR02574 family)
MTLTPEQITAAALAMSEEDRLDLLARLAESVEAPPGAGDGMTGEGWEAELKRRIDDFDSGREPGIPWAEVRRKLVEDAERDAG